MNWSAYFEQFKALHLGFHEDMVILKAFTHITCIPLPAQLLNSLLERSATQIIPS